MKTSIMIGKCPKCASNIHMSVLSRAVCDHCQSKLKRRIPSVVFWLAYLMISVVFSVFLPVFSLSWLMFELVTFMILYTVLDLLFADIVLD